MRGRPREQHLDGCRIVGRPYCCPAAARGEGHTETCPGFEANDPARYARTGSHYYGDGCPEHPVLIEGRPVYPSDPIIVPRHNRPASPLVRITREIWEERRRAEEKFPGQHLPDGTGQEYDRLVADLARKTTKARAADGTVTWRDVLIEEVFEAFAESDPERLRTELVQIAQVAVRWAEDIDRGAARGHHVPPDPETDPVEAWRNREPGGPCRHASPVNGCAWCEQQARMTWETDPVDRHHAAEQDDANTRPEGADQ
jgi:hypothetical protein